MARLRLGELFGIGFRSVSRYTGTVLSVFVVQSLVALAAMLAMTVVLANQFSHLPMFDEAVDGNLDALFWCIWTGRMSLFPLLGIALGAVLVWQLASWFLVGGLIGVFSQKPEGRADTARTFGAHGASTYLTYARLFVCALPGYALSLIALLIGVGAVFDRIKYALTIPQLVGPLVLAMIPGVVLYHFFSTVTDYARIELSLRGESHEPGVVKTYLRTLWWVLRRPLTLVHAGLGWVMFFLVSLAYMYLAHGHPMYGAEGAVTLFFVRQGVALLRMAIHLVVLGGQVELGRTRPLPPRKIEVKPEAKP